MNRLEEFNIILGQAQIENIYVTLSFIVGECMPQSRALLAPYGDNRTASMFEQVPNIQAMKETFRGIESIEFPESARGSVADTPNQRNYYRTKIQNLIKSNIQKCIQWCIQHNLAYNY